MKVTQVVSKFPPDIDGIGDYAHSLAQNLSRFDIETDFIVCNSSGADNSNSIRFSVLRLAAPTKSSFVETLPSDIDVLLLHFSDYPYEPKFGSPFWLLSALKEIKKQRRIKLIVMFHEFPYFFLRKSLYLLPLQKYVATQLAVLADVVMTNNSATQRQLSKLSHEPIERIAVFSNIGEPKQVPSIAERNRWLVIFGTPGRRARLYQRSISDIKNVLQLLNIEKIFDVGTSLNLNFSQINNIPVEELGEQPAQKVSQLMLQSLAGMAYSSDNQRLPKSGVFATYCAHGLVPVVTQTSSSIVDDLFEGKTFLSSKVRYQKLEDSKLNYISREAFKWYQKHSQEQNAAFFAKYLV